MSSPMRISLRAGERIYINGAVLRAERKMSFELLNNANFLLEAHILQAEQATTPLRQLYFALQTRLIEPMSNTARDAYARMYASATESFSTSDVLVGLRLVARLVEGGRIFEALKTLRGLFAVEATILAAAERRLEHETEEYDDGCEQHGAAEQLDRVERREVAEQQLG